MCSILNNGTTVEHNTVDSTQLLQKRQPNINLQNLIFEKRSNSNVINPCHPDQNIKKAGKKENRYSSICTWNVGKHKVTVRGCSYHLSHNSENLILVWWLLASTTLSNVTMFRISYNRNLLQMWRSKSPSRIFSKYIQEIRTEEEYWIWMLEHNLL